MLMARIDQLAFILMASLSLPAMAQVDPEAWVTIPAKSDPVLAGLAIPANAAQKGMWSPSYDWPMNGLHAALLSDGRVLTFGSSLTGGAQNGRWYDVWDPTLGFNAAAHDTIYDPSRQDSFCAAAVYRADGSMMISGGNGSDSSTIYDTASHSSYTANERMAEARWYPTLINLADGRPIILGGMMPYTEAMQDQPEQAIANGWPSMTPEVYENGQWRSLFGAYSRLAFGPDYLRTSYPRAWVAPDGRVFGISTDQMWYLDPAANDNLGAVTSAGVFKGPPSATNPLNVGPTSTAVMFAPGQILQVGGNGGFNGEELPASNMATLIDISSGAPVLTEQTPMVFSRRYPNAIVLADGRVVITGGATYGNYYAGQPAAPVYNAELWDPNTGSWTLGATAAKYRGYHSITTLMTNGAILSTGGGTPGPVTQLNAEVYYPPYLFTSSGSGSALAARPVMKAISGLSYSNGATLQVDMANGEAIAQLVLIGISSGTHSFNAGQRRIPLEFSQQQIRLTATIPNNFVVPPGYYQLVAIDANGRPSHGTIIGVGQNQAEPPIVTTPYVPPKLDFTIKTPVLQAGDAATYLVAAQAGSTYSWEVSDGTVTPYAVSADFNHTYATAGLYTVTVNARDNNGIVSRYTFVQAVSTASNMAKSGQSSPIILDSAANRVWVVNPDNNTVTVINALNNSVVAEIPVGKSPKTLALGGNNEVWITNKHSASISVINRNTLALTATIALPRASQPHGLVFNANGSSAFVALEASGNLVRIASATKQITGSLGLAPNIRHLALDAAGNRLLVSRFVTPLLLGENTAIVNTQAGGAEVLVVDLANFSLTNTILLQHSHIADTAVSGSGIPNYLGAPAIAPDGSLAWVPSKQDNIGRGVLRNGLPLDFQNSVRAIASAVQLGSLQEDFSRRIDLDNAGLSSAATFHPNGVYVFVALETSREIAVVNGMNGNPLFRVDVGIAPQGLAVSDDGLTLYVKEFMDRSVSVIDLTDLITKGQLKAIVKANVHTVQNERLAAEVLLGKTLFYDAKDTRLARDAYLSCASCHNEAGQDGRVWDFTGFGEGLRNTIQLTGRGDMLHGLLHWSGNFDEVQDFEKQIRNFAGGSGLMADADYFKTTVQAEDYENISLVAPFTQSITGARTVMLWPGSGGINLETTSSTAGQLHYSLTALASSITLFAMANLPSAIDDSFYVKLEGADADWFTFNNQATAGYEEREITTWTGLTVGQTYTLKILRREDNAQLDYFWVSGGQFGSSEDKAGISAELDALASYLGSLQGSDADKSFASSPYRASDGTYTAAALAGEALFAENCSSCHGGSNFANSSNEQAFRNVGTLNGASGQRSNGPLTALDVPTLRGVWATAPYLHNGSASSLVEAITAHQDLALSVNELNELAAYAQQIDGSSVVPTGGVFSDIQQAENQTGLNAAFSNSVAGYNGTGYLVLANGIGNWFEYNLDIPADGRYTVSLRYANGAGARAMSVAVNGRVQITNASLPATSTWQTWAEVSVEIDLVAGTNLVRWVALDAAASNSIEAENYNNTALVTPMAQSVNAGRNVMFWPGTGQINLTPADATNGQLHYSLSATGGSMTLFATVNLANGNDDSFYYKLEGVDGAWLTFNNQATSGFQERQIITWNGLIAGQNYTLKIMRREDGALLDSFRLVGGLFGSSAAASYIDQLAVKTITSGVNSAPTQTYPFTPVTLELGASASLELNSYFADADGDPLSFSVSASSNVQLSGTSLLLMGANPRSEVLAITAADGQGGQISSTLALTVLAAPVNVAPVVVNPIANKSLVVGDANQTINLNQVFSDTDGDTLTFTVTNSANVLVSGNTLVINTNSPVAQTITVTANDGAASVAQSFSLVVKAAPVSFSVEVQAETQSWDAGTVDANHAGFTGTGFVNTDNVANVWFQLAVNAPAAGSYRITVRYANGSTNRPQQVLVNGQNAISSFAMPPSGAWATWANVSFNVQLSAGANTIRFVSLTAAGAPNIDRFNVVLQ